MSDFYRRLIYFLAGGLLLLILYAGTIQAGRRLSSGMFRPFLGCWAAVRNRFSFFRKNKEVVEPQVQDQLYSQLLLEHRTRPALEAENRQLRAMLQLEPPKGWQVIHGDVILRDPVTWNWQFLISKGISSGVKLGNPVLFQNKLVGKVTEVYQESARVSTIGSPEFKCSVVVLGGEGKEYPGILQGNGNANGTDEVVCKVDYLEKNAFVHGGNLVLTSGMGTDFPYGVPIGVIGRNEGAATEVIEHARLRGWVKPAVDFSEIYAVAIVIHKE